MRVRRLLSTLVGAVMLAPVLLSSAPLTSPQPTAFRSVERSADETSDAQPEAPNEMPYTLTLSPTQPLLNVGDEIELRLLIENNDEADLAPGTIDISLHDIPITDADELLAEQLPAEGEALTLTTVETPTILAESRYETVIVVSAEESPLNRVRAPGIYLTSAAFTLEGESIEQVTKYTDGLLNDPAMLQAVAPLVWRGDELRSELLLSVIVPLVFPAAETPPLTPEEVERTFAADGNIAQLLAVAEATDATLAVDPKILAVVRALGNTASPAAQEAVNLIVSSDIDTFALQYADADPGLQGALDLKALLEPTNFSFVTRHFSPLPEVEEPETPQQFPEPEEQSLEQLEDDIPGADAAITDSPRPNEGSQSSEGQQPSPAPGSEPDPETDTGTDGDTSGDDENEGDDEGDDVGDQDSPPTRTELLKWQPTHEGFAWPAAGEVSVQTVSFLEQQGLDSIVLAGSSAVGSGNGSLGNSTAYVSERNLESFSAEFLQAENEADRGHAAAMLASLTALYGLPDPEAEKTNEALLALDRHLASTATDPQRVLEFMSELPWISPHSLSADPEQTVSLKEGSPKAERLETVIAALEREVKVADYSRVLEEPELLVDYQRDRLLTFMGAGLGEHAEDFETYTELYEENDQALLRGVSVVDTEHTRLLGTSSRIPVQLRNTLPFDAVVIAKLSATSAALIVEEPLIEATLIPAAGAVNQLVPVVSRVSNGESGLLVTLHDSADGPRIAARTLEITIQSETEVIALAALGAIAVMLFSFGIIRSIKRHRQDDAKLQAEK